MAKYWAIPTGKALVLPHGAEACPTLLASCTFILENMAAHQSSS